MRLAELVEPFPKTILQGDPGVEISGLAGDSRRVRPGDLFICLRGTRFDGHDFLASAFAAGAVGAIVERPVEGVFPGKTIVLVRDVDAILPDLAARFYGHPAARLNLIGVTGTNGKTTSTYLIRNILQRAGQKVGLIGTVQNLVHDRVVPAVNTTPGVLELQWLLAEMVAAGCSHVVMEVSSHAIALGRVRGCRFVVGLFTNITQDHLDFHRTFAEYLRVKQSFFAGLSPGAWAVINGDDPAAGEFLAATAARKLTFGLGGGNDLRAEEVELAMDGTRFTAVTPSGRVAVRLHLTGRFNVYNTLGAMGVGLALGIDLQDVVAGVEALTGVPGRFEMVPGGEGFGVVVDYAHTPDGLENVLRTARALATGRLIVVFGCGGDRDRGKRPLMGKVAARYADLIFLTSDNPRSEDPMKIIAEIEPGVVEGGRSPGEYEIIPDRARAIRAAVARAETGDLVVVAGKGHETYQIFADRTIHFDDREVAAQALEERKHGVLPGRSG
ncbi:MAG: UDP-N-acetylmuramoyl-L-alanyl-D-glutamate--2,6-diaminopimelate ligase [Firmicutes bacterium]|nr:UDP-N-acetylmuramoyl-L-alanyl-D-glutamate--2,6-diaminopimelate ligase [Bacillota bacterium]